MYKKSPRNYTNPNPQSNPYLYTNYYSIPNEANAAEPYAQPHKKEETNPAYTSYGNEPNSPNVASYTLENSPSYNHYPCGGAPICDKELLFANIYVQHQPFCQLYCPTDALMYGTIFPCLNQPYEGVFHPPCPYPGPIMPNEKGGPSVK